MKLLIDVGNSRIKSAILEQGRVHSHLASQYHEQEIESIFDSMLTEQLETSQVVVASVAGEAIELQIRNYFSRRCSAEPRFIKTSQEAAGLSNGYEDATQLGVDRWLAMIAAWNNFKSPVCIVDLGTALTIDMVANDGCHLGGYIVPGLRLMSDSLVMNTRQISIKPLEIAANVEPGQNTDSCIANGVMLAIKSLIEAACRNFSKEYGSAARCILTGGNAEQVMKGLDMEFEYEPHLVLKGIAVLIGEPE